ncbi:type VI secretion system tube protein Hcp [Paraburkholderia terrae]
MADIFLKINGIAGESQDAVHSGQIEVDSWRWKMAQQSTMMSGSGGGAGKATINDLQFVHQIDRASPNLMRYCLTGRHIARVKQEYKVQSDLGTSAGTVTASFDIKENLER